MKISKSIVANAVATKNAVVRNNDDIAPGSTPEDKKLAALIAQLKNDLTWAKSTQAKRNEVYNRLEEAFGYANSSKLWSRISRQSDKEITAIYGEFDRVGIFWSCDGH